MARGVTVQTSGFADLDRALGELGKATGRNVMRRAGIKALEPMAEDARRRAERNNWSGDLAASIAVSTKAAGYARRRGRKQNEVEVYMGPGGTSGGKAPPQGSLQEFGTRHHAPQPSMRPAWDAGKGQVLDDLKQSLGDEIMKAAERQARKAARQAAKGG